ncbi:MAG TPA: GrpB family protein [Phnomibacter sp.]|nr:GrpB family protein [Phnomibacter sp.]
MTNLLEPYNPNWKMEFGHIKQVLERELSCLNSNIDIEHIGSTSIEGLFAKPILDIDIILVEKDLIGDITLKLEKIGYRSKGEQGIPGRFAFRQTNDFVPYTIPTRKWQEHHLYVCFADSSAAKNHLLFRDALRKDKQLAAQYSQLKISLTGNEKMTRAEYSKLKTDLIVSVLAMQGLTEAELKEIIAANS